MQRDLAVLADAHYDLVVIGGGMFGAAAALDAVQRGLRVALVERGDFCGATSANSFKMLHGGIRYLQHADVPRIRQSAAARALFLRVAPHLAKPLPIVVPTYGVGMKSKAVLRAGMTVYDLVTAGRNRGIADPSRRIPRSWFLSRQETLSRYPGLAEKGLTGAGVFCDGQMYNPARLVLAFIQSAAGLGAACANYLEATRLLTREGRVEAVEVQDRWSGERFPIRSRMVLNAAGPYAERLLLGAFGTGVSPPTPFSRDAYFIVPRPLIAGDHALTVPSRTSDPDAMLSRGGRHLFLVPWRGVTLVGVWHKVYGGHPDHYEITEPELAGWIDEINGAYEGLGLTLDDVALGSAGLVPFGENDPEAEHLKFAHRSRIIDHAEERGLDGLMTIVGVRYTTGPTEAMEVVDHIARKLGRSGSPSRLPWQPVHGGDVPDFEALVGSIQAASPVELSAQVARALAHAHGSAYPQVLEHVRMVPGLGRVLSGSTVLAAEIAHAAKNEMALTLADAVFRRTDLCTSGLAHTAALQDAAQVMAAACGWTTHRQAAELEYVRERLLLARTGRAFLTDSSLPSRPLAA